MRPWDSCCRHVLINLAKSQDLASQVFRCQGGRPLYSKLNTSFIYSWSIRPGICVKYFLSFPQKKSVTRANWDKLSEELKFKKLFSFFFALVSVVRENLRKMRGFIFQKIRTLSESMLFNSKDDPSLQDKSLHLCNCNVHQKCYEIANYLPICDILLPVWSIN